MKLISKHRIIRRFLLSYLILLIIPLITSGIIYRRTAVMVEKDIMTANNQYLEDSKAILDKELENLDFTVKRLIMNQEISTFLNTPYPETGSSEIIKIINASYAISSYRIKNDFFTDFYIYSRLNKIILTTSRVHTEIENDYETFFRYGGLSFNQWQDELLNTYHQYEFLPELDVKFSGKNQRVIPFIQSIPFNSRRYFKGNILSFINVKKLNELLGRLNRGTSGCVYLINRDETILSRIGQPGIELTPSMLTPESGTSIQKKTIGGYPWIVSQTTSNISGFRIISILPTSFIDHKVDYIKKIIFLITAVLISIGIFAALIFAYLNSKPVIEIADIARKQLNDVSFNDKDLDVIKKSMTGLIIKNRELVDYKQKQLPIMQASFLDRLLRGYIENWEDVFTFMKYNELLLTTPPFNVILVNTGGYGSLINNELLQERELNRIIIEENMKKAFQARGYCLQMDSGNIAWIYCGMKQDLIKKQIDILLSTMQDEYSMNLCLSRGRARMEISGLPIAYREAEQGMEYLLTIDKGTGICHFDDLPIRTDCFYYNIEIESQLILYTKTGQIDRIIELLDEIDMENFQKRELSVSMMRRFLEALLGTIVRINEFFLEDSLTGRELNTISSISSAADEFSEIRGLFTSLCLKVTSQKDTQLKNLQAGILKYVNENFSNPGFNLYMLAAEFDYKESYLYHFFNDYMGSSFSSYLESVRINKACELLERGDESIDSIADKTGYGSSHSFRRAFKRKKNISPSIYKKSAV